LGEFRERCGTAKDEQGQNEHPFPPSSAKLGGGIFKAILKKGHCLFSCAEGQIERLANARSITLPGYEVGQLNWRPLTMSHVPSPFRKVEEAANYLRLNKRTLDNMRWMGTGPAFRKRSARAWP
jgi:hypothetical protein